MTAEKTPSLVRCPKCRCAQPQQTGGWCRACGWPSAGARWREHTRLFPVQPEERNDHRCLDCGTKVVVTMPLQRPVIYPWFPWLAMGILVSAIALKERDWRIPAGVVALVALVAPLHVMYLRYRGRVAASSIVVRCPACGLVRIGGEVDEAIATGFRRGTVMFDTQRFAQCGRWDGQITIAGDEIAVTPDHCGGSRDRRTRRWTAPG